MSNPIQTTLEKQWGIHFPYAFDMLPKGVTHDISLAADAQPGLVTVSNSGIPAYLANYLDPKIVEVLVAPMKIAQIVGEAKKGDFSTVSATFPVIEYTGQVSAYDDNSGDGMSGANTNWNTREMYSYQTMTKWGVLEMERAGLGKIDWASRLNLSSILALNKFQNQTYAFGVSGLRNYGLLNDPALPASLTPTAVWTLAGTSAEVIYEDIRRIFAQLTTQTQGLIDQEADMVMAMSPTISACLDKTNTYNVNVMDMLKKNFPNLRVITAPEYATAGGQLVQLIVRTYEGQDTATCAFGEKLRAFPIILGNSNYSQKKAQTTFGTVVFRPVMIASMIGV